MKTIPLETRERVVGYAMIDDDAETFLKNWTWRLGTSGYAEATSTGRKHVFMHRLIVAAPEDMIVDHINGNALDNRRDNLRLTNFAGNSRNRAPSGSRRYKGVFWTLKSKKPYAAIRHEGKNHYLGTFPDEETAVRAYDAAAMERFGEFARLNFPRES